VDRRAALAEGDTLPDRSSGSALFVDISGFTPLTAALAEELGPDRGAEALTNHLNHVYGALIDQVHAYHGSVIGFSGDAITCWFDGDDGRRAVTAALAMQKVMEDLNQADEPGDFGESIGIKTAVAAGSARRFLVGDPHVSYLEVLAGSILDRTAEGEKLAAQGEVLISKEVRDALGDDLQILGERAGAESQPFFLAGSLAQPAAADPWTDVPCLATDVTQQWILPPVFQRLGLGEGQFLSELRPAVAVFLKFGGIDYDGDEEAREKLDQFVRWVQSLLERYGGSLFQVTLGDKGSYLLMVFGAPIAHEDDMARALSAAVDLQQPPPHLSFVGDIQIGVNRGQIFAGAYGGPQRMTYGSLGDAVNVAARLMEQAAPGQILMPERLGSLIAKEFQYLPLGRRQMKGLMGPIAVASLKGRCGDGDGQALSRTAVEDSIVGRGAEKAVVEEMLNALAGGESGVLVVEGEAGIGKSSLVAQLTSQAQTLGLLNFEGAGDAVEQTSPYFAWRRIMRLVFDDPDQSDAEMEERVVSHLQAIDPDLPRLAPLLNAVLPVNLPDNELTEAMIGEVRADNLQDLLVSILVARASKAPCVLILEDAHWLDSASWALSRIVARDVTPLLLVIATRPQDPPSADFVHLRNGPSSRVVTLDLLDADEILAIIGKRLGVDNLPRSIAKLILDKAEGHPFFGEELAYALRDAGYLRIENGRAELAASEQELERLTFPDTIQGVITSRIDRVTPQQQLTLKVASVIGRMFAYRILHDIYPIENSDRELHSNLEILEKLDITPLEAPDPELAYIFRHIITQEVTYGLLTFAQRKRLHQAAAV
jgi:class 3 adenylate cyclase